jgi:hypothetical protein
MVGALSNAIDGRLLTEFVSEAAQMISEWWIVEAMTLLLLRLHQPADLRAVLHAAELIQTPDLKSRIIGRISLRLARLGYIGDALETTAVVPLVVERGRILADVASDLAADHDFQAAKEMAESIMDREEYERASSLLALHMAASGRLDDAVELASRLQTDHWKATVLPQLHLARRFPAASGIPTLNPRPGWNLPTEAPPENESLREAAQSMMERGFAGPELDRLLTALSQNDLGKAEVAGAALWRTEGSCGKTFFEVISSLPRPEFLRQLQRCSPLLVLALDENEVSELVAAIQQVGTWWP